MDTIPKFLASVFVIIIAVYIGISLLICGTSIVSARSFYSNASDAISSVDTMYEESIIEECKTLAAKNGYVLEAEKIVTVEGQYYYELILKYNFVAPFFGKTQTGTVSGYVYPGTHSQTLPI